MSAATVPYEARAVVFDLDGVLVESEHVNVDSARIAFERFGHRLPDEAAAQIVGRHPADYVPEFAERLGLRPDSIDALMRYQDRLYRDRWTNDVHMIGGASETIRALGKRGFRLGLATSAGRSHLEACLDRFGLRGSFLALVTKDDVRRRKPDPEAYSLAVHRLGVSARDAVAVEDSPHGVRAALAAGLLVIAVTGDHVPRERLCEADLVVDRITAVIESVRLRTAP